MSVKLIRFIFLCFSLLAVFNNTLNAQLIQRCGTSEAINQRLLTDSAYKADYEAKLKDPDSYIRNHSINTVAHKGSAAKSFANGDTVIIPVVVHIVLPNPNIITDDDVQYFINRLNLDYSGFNPDSANGSPFYSVRGHSQIRFTLARRDINGKYTTGIERKVGVGTISGGNPQTIKTAAAGLPPWDITQYYNLWVGNGSALGLLGISPEIGPAFQTGNSIDGICCDYTGFSHNSCYSASAYNLARTCVHEIGHNMGLCHPFQGGCTSADFTTNLSSAGLALPANMVTTANDDTPPTSAATYGVPAAGAKNGCTPSIPKMFQNFMDYSDDIALTMFTKNQVIRMHYVIDNFRPGYWTTKGYLLPDSIPQNEASATSIVNPGGNQIVGCTSVNYSTPVCGADTFTPKLQVTNYGSTLLKSITVGVLNNGVLMAKQTFTTSLDYAKSDVFTLPLQHLINGTNVLKFFTSSPNGLVDSFTNDDTLTKVVNFNNSPIAASVLPIFEGFEDPGFNPTKNGWIVFNPTSGTNTFVRTTAAAKTGTACVSLNMFGNSATSDVDYLVSPGINFNNTTDSAFISFDYAYILKSTATASKKDTLSVVVTNGCDPSTATWTSLWKNGGSALSTNARTSNTSWTAISTDWKTSPVIIPLTNYRNAPFYIAFKTTNGNGQNIYIDNINIYTKSALPLTLVQFVAQQNANDITCRWQTANELNVNNFEIERSIDGKSFEKIGSQKAIGNTTINSFYQFTDESAYTLKSAVIYYRLKSVDNDGKYTYSNVVAVKIGEKQVVNVYPNPATNFINVEVTNTNTNNTKNTIQIVDYVGRVVYENQVTTTLGTQTYNINISKLAKGNYVLMLKNNFDVKVTSFIKD